MPPDGDGPGMAREECLEMPLKILTGEKDFLFDIMFLSGNYCIFLIIIIINLRNRSSTLFFMPKLPTSQPAKEVFLHKSFFPLFVRRKTASSHHFPQKNKGKRKKRTFLRNVAATVIRSRHVKPRKRGREKERTKYKDFPNVDRVFAFFFSPTVSSKEGSGSANFLIVVICTKVGNEEGEEEPLFCHFSLSPSSSPPAKARSFVTRDFPLFFPISSVARMHFPTFFFFSAQKKIERAGKMGRVTDLIVPFFFAEWPASFNGFRYSWPFAWSQGVSKIPKSIYHDFSLPVFTMLKKLDCVTPKWHAAAFFGIFFPRNFFFALRIAERGFLKKEENPRIKNPKGGGKRRLYGLYPPETKIHKLSWKYLPIPPTHPLPKKLESDAPLIGASSSNPRFPWSIFMACARKKKQRGRDLRSGGHLWKWPGRAAHGIPQIITCRFF